MKDAADEIEGDGVVVDEEIGDEADWVFLSDGGSQPLDVNSEEIRFRIIESGTRLPDCMAASA
jgi:hypothetical protein